MPCRAVRRGFLLSGAAVFVGDCDPHVVAEVHGIGRTLAVRRPRRALGLSWMQAQLDAMPRVQAREGLPRRPVRDADSNGAL